MAKRKMTPEKAITELREYFEQKRNAALRRREHPDTSYSDKFVAHIEANAYDHAADVVENYQAELFGE